ncbi:MAG: tRNA (guanosine(46)-N7)-methyltransferase TrmB [Phycisphaeraceae bacterium]|nr:tRNA (guanosine(46)-N7)-methyltransferase TrmB [Phycisphaeraceae bacterium]
MSFGLGRGRRLDVAPGVVGVEHDELGPLPDEILTDPRAGWVDVRALFETPERPLEIEIGSGKGTFLLQQAALAPDTNFLGIEWAQEFYAYACDRVRRRGLANVRLLNADATEFLHWRAPDQVASVIHLYFSDPWPKKKHHKKRVVQDRFLSDCARVLEPGGELRIVTDHDEYWAWMEAHFARWAASDSAAPDRPTFERLPFDRAQSAGADELVGTNFERKFRVEGRSFHACVLRAPGVERG